MLSVNVKVENIRCIFLNIANVLYSLNRVIYLYDETFNINLYFRAYLGQFPSPVLFCHNDLQEGNILLKMDKKSLESSTPSLLIIDYEYCAYNYRAFELANHFIEWIFDYKHDEYPFYKTHVDNYPSVAQQVMWK